MTKSLTELLDERDATARQGAWVPACGGTEVPFTARTGHRLLYCHQPSTGSHAYLDLGSDMFLSEEEIRAILG